MAKRVSIVNFKGGVGKTTLAFNLAAGLARFYDNTRVLLIDIDHQSSLSIVCLNATGWQERVSGAATVNEVFQTFTDGSALPDDSIIVSAPLSARYPKKYDLLDVVPSALELDDTEIELTASLRGNAIKSEWNKRTLLCRWIDEAKIDKRYDYIIFDCPPATKVVSQNAIAASHGYIIPVVPEAVMERGAPHLSSMIANGIDKQLKTYATMGDKRRSFVRDTKLVGTVVTRIQAHGPAASGYTDDHTIHLDSLQRTWRKDLLEPYILSGTGVSQAMDAGAPVYERRYTRNIGYRGIDDQFKDLTKALKRRIDRL